jgi:hypothetical protein
MEYKRTNIQLEPDQHEWLRRKSYKTKKSIGEIIREMLWEKMREEETKPE